MRKPLGFKRLHASTTEKYAVVPPWLIVMCNSMFFRNCMAHPDTKKNKLDRFCIDCLCSFCSHCIPAHELHKHVKIRRYVYSEVINRHDLCKLFNCSGIQSYHTNNTKVLFLRQRNHHHHQHQQQKPQHHQQINSKDYSCVICDRNLKDNSLYCSIACKVVAIFGERKNDNDNKVLRSIKNEEEEEEEYFTPQSPKIKKQSPKRSRKGVPIRAPML